MQWKLCEVTARQPQWNIKMKNNNLLELEGCFVQIESGSVAFPDVERNVSGVERFNHCSCSLFWKKCTRGYESVKKMNKEKLRIKCSKHWGPKFAQKFQFALNCSNFLKKSHIDKRPLPHETFGDSVANPHPYAYHLIGSHTCIIWMEPCVNVLKINFKIENSATRFIRFTWSISFWASPSLLCDRLTARDVMCPWGSSSASSSILAFKVDKNKITLK